MEEMDTKVQLGDDSFVDVKGVGTAKVNFMDDNGNLVTLELSNCYYVPALSKNLLSVRKPRKKQIMSDMQTHEDKASLTKAGVTVWSVIDSSVDLYLFEQASAYVGVGQQTIDLCHARMGHLGYQNLARLVHRGTGHGLSIPKHQLRDFPVCDECTRANQQRASFKHTHTEHADTVNGLVFTDIKGPIETDSSEVNAMSFYLSMTGADI
ncbi:hypothetical protein PI125_g15405 [Phytophthora idaei]|nr:hypothetical protein PI125_g15405 [Phytophthora idaei]